MSSLCQMETVMSKAVQQYPINLMVYLLASKIDKL